MPSIRLFKPRKKEEFAKDFKAAKATIFSEAVGRSTNVVPNIRSLSWSPTGALVATCTASNIRIWNPERANVRSSTEVRAASATNSIIEKLSFNPRHEALLASTGGDGICRLWDVRLPGAAATSGKGTCLSEAKVGDTGLFLTWHPDGQELLVGRKDDEVQLVDIRRMNGLAGDIWETSVQEKTPKKDKGQFNGMAFSNTGRELFVTTGEGPVKILDWPSLDELHTLNAHSSATNVVQHSPAGTYVAVGGNDSMITLWDTTDWVCTQTITTQSSSVRDLSFSYDGSYVVASYGPDARDGSAGIHISHVESGEDALVYDTTNPVTWAAWHPWRHWLAYAGDPGGLKIISSLNM